MRQYGAIPAPNAPANTPAVSATTGLGIGGGAAVQTADSGNYGNVLVYIGTSPDADLTIDLTFPDTPPELFIAGNDDFGIVTQSTDDNVVTITCTGHSLVPRSEPYSLAYEWEDYLEANP